jgi:hypothetical protein
VAVAAREGWPAALDVLIQEGSPVYRSVRVGVTDPVLQRILDLEVQTPDAARVLKSGELLKLMFRRREEPVEGELVPHELRGINPAASNDSSQTWRKQLILAGLQDLGDKELVYVDECRNEGDESGSVFRTAMHGVDYNNEASVLIAIARNFVSSHFFLFRPGGWEYLVGAIRMISELDEHFGPGNWQFSHDQASYSVTSRIAEIIREEGARQCQLLPRKPQDLQTIELFLTAFKWIVMKSGADDHQSFVAAMRAVVGGAVQEPILEFLVAAMPMRLQMSVLLAGRGLPAIASGPDGVGPGAKVTFALPVPPALMPPGLYAAFCAAMGEGLTRAELSLKFGFPEIDVGFMMTRFGSSGGNLLQVSWEDFVVLGIFPAYDGTPCVISQDARGRFVDVEACHKLAGVPVFLDKVRAFSRSTYKPVVVGWADDGAGPFAVVECNPGGDLYRHRAPFAYRMRDQRGCNDG